MFSNAFTLVHNVGALRATLRDSKPCVCIGEPMFTSVQKDDNSKIYCDIYGSKISKTPSF